MRPPESPASTRRHSEAERTDRWVVRLGAEPWPAHEVGGKANGLVTLARAGMRVPAGFVITAPAFKQAVEQLVADVTTLAGLRAALASAELPVALVDEVSAELANLGSGPWAVRSSALEEDGADQSFAGQHRTVLNVASRAGVLDAIREVWAGTLEERALRYRTRLAVDAVPAGIAVVVQEMVQPDSAGVTFTRDPTAPRSDEAVVCAARGLGTRVVGGGACDTYYIERPSGYLRRSDLNENVLSPEALGEMARACERAERAFGGPLDLEWARVGSEYTFLQARPITGDAAQQASVWTNSNVGEALPGVATPLTWSVIRRFSRRGFERAFGTLGLDVPADYELVGSFAGRVYLNLTQFAEITSQIPILSPDTLFEMAGGGGVELVRHVYDKRDPGGFLMRLPATIPRIVASQLAMPAVAPLWNTLFETWTQSFFARDLEPLNHEALGDELDRLDRMFDLNGEFMLACASNFLMSYAVVREALRALGRVEVHGREQEMLRGLHVPSAEAGLALLELGRIARRSRRLRRLIEETPPGQTLETLRAASEYADVETFLEALDAFRAQFGHRAPREAELATPRWREDSTYLFDVLRGFLAAPHLPSRRDVDRDREKAEGEVGRLIAEAFIVPGIGRAFRVLLGLVRGNARRREMLRDRVVDSLDVYRRYFLECGRRMRDRGDLAAIQDVFFLNVDEIRDWLDDVSTAREYRYRVLVRRALHEMFTGELDPPNIFVLRGSELVSEDVYLRRDISAPIGDGLHEIAGLPASPGRRTGPARVITNPSDASTLRSGEILVIPYADIGWTPMFLTAAAVVMDLGGPLSHAAIVAREYGLPAVVNARGVLQTIQTGDTVTVDGDRGVVFVRHA